jgi:hypothetical protein
MEQNPYEAPRQASVAKGPPLVRWWLMVLILGISFYVFILLVAIIDKLFTGLD